MISLFIYYYYLLWGIVGAEVLRRGSTGGKTDKIIGFTDDISIADTQDIVESYGVKVKKTLPLANACLCEVEDGARVQSLILDRKVEFVEDDFVGRVLVMPSRSTAYSLQSQRVPWGIERIKAPKVWSKYRGEGVRVGIIDTGIDRTHPDLKDNIAEACGVLDCNNIDDDNGHGTHVAGIVAAADNRIGVIGAAPRAKLYPVKAFDSKGRGQISNIVDALQKCVDNNVQVINMSFGFDKRSRALERAISEVNSRGIILVAAAGNSGGTNTVMHPARQPEVIAVAASDYKDKVAAFSSNGPEVDIIAPGVDIDSTYLKGGYKTLSGTSMASPHVTGSIALMLGAGANPKEIRTVLTQTAEDLGHPKEKQGSGLPQVPVAISKTKNARHEGNDTTL